MNPTDRDAFLQELGQSRTALLEAVQDQTEEQAARRPDGGWSVLDCVEHCVAAEEAMLAMLTGPGEPVEPSDRSKIEASIRQRAGTRVRKVAAPPAMLPAGRFDNLVAATAAFCAARDRTIAFVESCDSELRDRLVEHPVGKVTARECLLLLILHPVRHAEQIRELRG